MCSLIRDDMWIDMVHERAEKGSQMLESCSLCPRKCLVNRRDDDQKGCCLIGRQAKVVSYGPHFGEESVLVGEGGSGTIFFCGCNLLCRFCQNYEVSQSMDAGCKEVSPKVLASIMLKLQEMGCSNINFVTPSHVVPQILSALVIAAKEGLKLPLVYNCGGYEEKETLKLLDGIIDIYMPDCKFYHKEFYSKYIDVTDYTEKMCVAVSEMQRQVGDLILDEEGIAIRGLLVRHLLMPGGMDETKKIIEFLADSISKNCYLNLMDQYRPCGETLESTNNDVELEKNQYQQAREYSRQRGLTRLDAKDYTLLFKNLLK